LAGGQRAENVSARIIAPEIVDMAVWAVWSWVPPLLNVVLLVLGLFLILLILIQKGKGGGLAGAFGGAGGSSAFGTRAGDAFTRITIYVAAVWILLIMVMIKMIQPTAPLQAAQQQAIPDAPTQLPDEAP
jgi:preprotein translocase subunit SecG